MGKQKLERKKDKQDNKQISNQINNVEFASEKDFIDVIDLVDKNIQQDGFSKRE